jgi:hypothetical protein
MLLVVTCFYAAGCVTIARNKKNYAFGSMIKNTEKRAYIVIQDKQLIFFDPKIQTEDVVDRLSIINDPNSDQKITVFLDECKDEDFYNNDYRTRNIIGTCTLTIWPLKRIKRCPMRLVLSKNGVEKTEFRTVEYAEYLGVFAFMTFYLAGVIEVQGIKMSSLVHFINDVAEANFE